MFTLERTKLTIELSALENLPWGFCIPIWPVQHSKAPRSAPTGGERVIVKGHIAQPILTPCKAQLWT